MFNWNILGKYEDDDVVLSILKGRGIKDKKDFLKDLSLNESFDKFSSDFKKSLKKAKDLINKEIDRESNIVIFGDYDSDGINATAILYNYLKDERKYKKVSYFIPNRFEHSYGLSKRAIDDVVGRFKKGENILFITVDVGITAYEEVSYIKKLGYGIVLTDHHQKPDKIPPADCILWSDEICGALISWILAKALGSKNTESVSLASIATITDLQTVLGFNRVIVKKGLEVLSKKPPLGIKKLLEASGKGVGDISTYEVGWIIGPRLNAAGRLETAEDSIKLLTEKDEKELEKLAEKLNTKNIQRQEKTLEMYEIASTVDNGEIPKVIFSSDEKYHEGVIGLVAAKLVQKYYRPSIVICLMDGYAKGSARSIPGVNIIEMLRNFEDLFIDLGGHPMAAGFTIEKKNISKLERKIKKYAEEKISENVFIPTITIDLEIPAAIITDEMLMEVDNLKPFGIGNEQPVFISRGLGVVNSSVIGKDEKHLKLSLYDGEKYFKAVYFEGAEFEKDLNTGDKIDLVYTLKKNEYNGSSYIDLIVKDYRKV